MMDKVVKTIEEFHMLKKGDRVVAGVSGGADSVALLLMLCKLCDAYNLTIYVAHINHGIRGEEAKRDEVFVKRLCEKLAVPCFVKQIDVHAFAKARGLSVEEAGREVRYSFFEEIAKAVQADKVAVAHNLNDQTETFLMRLCRGTGLRGLAGIPATRDNIIRPLIQCARKEIECWLEAVNQDYCTDTTNAQTDYTRNKIRLELIPFMEKELNTKAVLHIANTAAMLGEEEAFIESEAERAFKKLSDVLEESVYIQMKGFLQVPKVLQRRIVRMALKKLEPEVKDVSFNQIKAVLELTKNSSGKKINLSNGFIAAVEYENLVIQKNKNVKKINFCYDLVEGKEIFIKEANITVKMSKNNENINKNDKFVCTNCFDYDKIYGVIQIRNRRTNDILSINKAGGHKKLKDYFIDEKIPRRFRDQLLLIAFENNILWVMDKRIGAYYLAEDNTKNKLYITVRKTEEMQEALK